MSARVQTHQPALSAVQPTASQMTLQRACGCGRHTHDGGACAECRTRRLRAGSLPPAAAAHRPVSAGSPAPLDLPGVSGQSLDQHVRPQRESRFSHDFSQVRPHTAARAAPGAGGAVMGQQDAIGVSDERRSSIRRGSTLPYREATGLAECIRIMGPQNSAYCRQEVLGETPPSAPVLSRRITLGPAPNGCGGFDLGGIFSVENATARTNGFVVQKVTFNLSRELCGGGRDDFTTTYWEAWQVRNGVVYIGTLAARHDSDGIGDRFSVPSTPGERGVNVEEGYARYIDGYTEPLTWGHIPEARALPATRTQPAGWSDSGTIHRWMRNEFDCCNGRSTRNFTSQG